MRESLSAPTKRVSQPGRALWPRSRGWGGGHVWVTVGWGSQTQQSSPDSPWGHPGPSCAGLTWWGFRPPEARLPPLPTQCPQWGIEVHSTPWHLSLFNPHPRTCLLTFRARGREGEREGRRETSV